MAKGLRVRGPVSIATIDNTYQNLALRASGTFSVGTSTGGGYWIGSLTLAADTPVLAVRSDNPCFINSSVRSGGNVVFTFVVVAPAGSPPNIAYYLFDKANYGLKFNTTKGIRARVTGDGSVTFDSRMLYLNIIAQRSAVYDNSQDAAARSDLINYNQTFSGRTVAVIQTMYPWNYTSGPVDPSPTSPIFTALDAGMFRTPNASQVIIARQTYGVVISGTSPDPVALEMLFSYSYQIVDITPF